MARKTTIYRVVTYDDGMMRHYHFPTKSKALQFIKDENHEEGSPEIDAVEVTLNAAGIAEALDDFITMTCANEG